MTLGTSRLPGTLLVFDHPNDGLPGGLRHTGLQHPVHLVLDLLDVVPRQDQLLADSHAVNEFGTQQAFQAEFRAHVDGFSVHVPFVCGGQDVLQLDMDTTLPVHGGVHSHSACVVLSRLDEGSASRTRDGVDACPCWTPCLLAVLEFASDLDPTADVGLVRHVHVEDHAWHHHPTTQHDLSEVFGVYAHGTRSADPTASDVGDLTTARVHRLDHAVNALGCARHDGFAHLVITAVAEDIVCVVVALTDPAKEIKEFGGNGAVSFQPLVKDLQFRFVGSTEIRLAEGTEVSDLVLRNLLCRPVVELGEEVPDAILHGLEDGTAIRCLALAQGTRNEVGPCKRIVHGACQLLDGGEDGAALGGTYRKGRCEAHERCAVGMIGHRESP
jgi:hypothetical protein